MTEPGTKPPGGAGLEAEIDAQLALEWDRKASLEQRGINVITASGALVTLVFAVSAIVTKSQTYKFFRGWEHWLLVAALIFFVAAAIGGIASNNVARYRAVEFPVLGLWMKVRQDYLARHGNDGDTIPWDEVESLLGGGALGKAAHLVKSSETGPPPDTVMLKDLVGLLRDTGRTQEAEELVRLLGREPASSANLITTTPPGIGQVDLDNIALRKYNVLLTARYFNYRKARLLLVSMISEVIAIALVAGSIVFLLAHYG